MTTSIGIYQPIFSHLRSNNFHFSEAWVKDCVNRIKSAKPGISLEALKNDVHQQWLLLNLRDFNVPSLPPDLKPKKEIVINGKFAVQVESMIDSSRSCYSQFQNLLKTDFDHGEIKEEGKKSNRCLTFLISDGVQELHAMEYEIIKKIKTNDPKLRPGFKMVIVGPVECRKGMFLLKDENVILCGGEVEALVTLNSLKNILIRKLELDAADYPEITSDVIEETETSQIRPSETFSGDNLDDVMVESLLSQDEDVFLNIPLSPLNNDRQTADCQGRTLQSSDLDKSVSPSQNLIEFEDDDDIFENYTEQESELLLSMSNSGNPVQTKLSSFFKNNESSLNGAYRTSVDSKRPNFVSGKPFVYLKHIMSVRLIKPTVFTVKAVILSLTKKLTVEKGEYVLRAIITDGSLSVNVDFCSEVLENLLGYSPCEMVVMIKTKETNSAIAQRIKESFSKTQEKLISLNCLMEIKFFPDGRNPLVLSLNEVTTQTLTALKERKLMNL